MFLIGLLMMGAIIVIGIYVSETSDANAANSANNEEQINDDDI